MLPVGFVVFVLAPVLPFAAALPVADVPLWVPVPLAAVPEAAVLPLLLSVAVLLPADPALLPLFFCAA